MVEGPFLLDDTSYSTILLEGKASGDPPVFQHKGKDNEAFLRVVEHFSAPPEDGRNRDFCSVVLVGRDHNSMNPAPFPDLSSAIEKGDLGGSLEKDSSWEFIQPRTNAKELCIQKSCTSLRYRLVGKEHEFLVVKVTSVRPEQNPIALRVAKVLHTDDTLQVSLEGRYPSNILNSLVKLHGVHPEVDGIHMVQRITSISTICIRLKKGLPNNCILFDAKESQAQASATFSYTVDNSKALHHVIPGDKSLLEKQRITMPLGVSHTTNRNYDQLQPTYKGSQMFTGGMQQKFSTSFAQNAGRNTEAQQSEPSMLQNLPTTFPRNAGEHVQAQQARHVVPQKFSVGAQHGFQLVAHASQGVMDPNKVSNRAPDAPFGRAAEENSIQTSDEPSGSERQSAYRQPHSFQQLGHQQTVSSPQSNRTGPKTEDNQLKGAVRQFHPAFGQQDSNAAACAWGQTNGVASPQPVTQTSSKLMVDHSNEQNAVYFTAQHMYPGNYAPHTQIAAFPGQPPWPTQSLQPDPVGWNPPNSQENPPQADMSVPGASSTVSGKPSNGADPQLSASLMKTQVADAWVEQPPGSSGSNFQEDSVDVMDIISQLCEGTSNLKMFVATLCARGMAQPLEETLIKMRVEGPTSKPDVSAQLLDSETTANPGPNSFFRTGLGDQPLRFEHLPLLKLDGLMKSKMNGYGNLQALHSSHSGPAALMSSHSGQPNNFQVRRNAMQ